MYRRLIALLLLFTMAVPAHAMVTPMFISSSFSSVISTTGTRFFTCAPHTGVASSGDNLGVMAISGTMSNLKTLFPVTITTGSYTLTVRKNGVDTSLAVTASPGNQSPSDTDPAHAVTFAPGDLCSMRIVPTGGPESQGPTIYSTAVFTGANAGESQILSASLSPTSSGALTFAIPGAAHAQGTELQRTAVFPTSGTIDMLYASSSTAVGVGTSWTVTLRQGVGGAATATTSLSCSITVAGGCQDLVNSVSVSAGDLLSFAIQANGAPTTPNALSIAVRFRPAIDGESVMLGVGGNAVAAAVSYQLPNGFVANTVTEAQTTQLVPTAFTWKKLYIDFAIVPSTGRSRTYFGRQNSATTTLTAQVSGTNRSGSDTTNSVSVVAGDLINFSDVPSGSPTAPTRMSMGSVMYIPTVLTPAALAPSKFRIFGGKLNIFGGRTFIR